MTLTRPAAGSPARRTLTVLLLLVFVVADVMLVMTAFRQTGGAPAAVPTPPETVRPTTASVPTPEQTPPEEAEEEEPIAAAVPADRFITALSATEAWRTTAGSCPDGAVVAEYTEDGGASWEQFDVTAATGAAQAVRIQAVDEAYVFLITLDDQNCGPQFSATYTAGVAWEAYSDERLAGTWFVRPDEPQTVLSPVGPQQAPCDVVALAPLNESEAAVLCSDRRLFRTADSAVTWDSGLDVPGGVAIAADADEYIVAASGVESCPGLELAAIAPILSDQATIARGCTDVAAGPADVALGVRGGALWLWAGDVVARSLDGGQTWE